MDDRTDDIMEMMAKINEHKLMIATFTTGLMGNIDIFCTGNDMMIDGVYTGTSFESKFRLVNKNIRLAALMLVQAMKESEAIVDVKNVRKAQIERALRG